MGRARQEIERKFVVDPALLPDLKQLERHAITQFYLVAEPNKEVRVRQIDRKYFMTVKFGNGLARDEIESETTEESFENLKPLHKGVGIEKVRYILPLESHKVEVDVYRGALRGLIVGEVEFGSKEEAKSFVPPEWLSHEVTLDSRFKNKALALSGAKQIEYLKPPFGLVDGVNAAVSSVERLLESQKAVLVLVAGGSASGKTSAVASKLSAAFPDSRIISIDDYYKGVKFMDEQDKKGIKLNFDQPEVLDLELLRSHIEQLKNGQAIEKPIYDKKSGERAGSERVEPKRVLIIEGLFALNETLKDSGDVKVFVRVGRHGSLIRRFLRDIDSTVFLPKDIIKYNLGTVEPMYDKYVEPTAANADMIIENDYNPIVEAKRTNQEEFQVKFRTSDEISSLFAKLGLQFIAATNQVDTYYKLPRKPISGIDESLRVRNENGHFVMTYKGPTANRSKRLRERYKLDVEIDGETDGFIRKRYEPGTIIEKERKLYALGGNLIALDKVTRILDGKKEELGTFVEMRFSSRKAAMKDMKPFAKKLGLEGSEPIILPYISM